MSLFRTAGRVAVASAVHGRVQRRQQARWAQEDRRSEAIPPPQTHAPQTSAPSAGSVSGPDETRRQLDLLAQLGELRTAGVLTEEEFARKKTEILASVAA